MINPAWWGTRWFNFAQSELACPCCGLAEMHPEVVDLLQAMRTIHGRPIQVTSGYRCEKHNRDIGSKTLNHPHGWAVDLECSNSTYRLELLDLARAVRFRRIEIGTKHVHLDLNPCAPQDVLFLP